MKIKEIFKTLINKQKKADLRTRVRKSVIFYLPNALEAVFTNEAKPFASLTAISASIFLLIVTPAFLRPFMKVE